MSSDGLRDHISAALKKRWDDYGLNNQSDSEYDADCVLEAVRGYLATMEDERVEAAMFPGFDGTEDTDTKALRVRLRAADRVVGLLRDDEETQR